MSDFYILFSVGPVQLFIMQARRTQDLWVGSRLLSFLAQAGVRYAVQTLGEQSLIYPATQLMDDVDNSFPNRFLISVTTDDPHKLAETIKGKIETEWKALADSVRDYIYTLNAYDLEIWNRQVSNWLEINYVIHPVRSDFYGADNEVLNGLLSSRKLIRDFSAVAEYGHKCSITGEHEALSPQSNAPLSAVQVYWSTLREKLKNLALLNEGERLCALSAIKRFVHEVENPNFKIDRFPSTSSIASASWRAHLLANWQNTEIQEATGAYLVAVETLFKSINREEVCYLSKEEAFPYMKRYRINDERQHLLMRLDGDLLYQDTYQAKLIADYANVDVRILKSANSTQYLKDVQDKLKDLYKLVGKPSSYLGILAMDGDHMGKIPASFSKASDHSRMSHEMANFAIQVKQRIEQDTPARLIFAGGDDVLALLPIDQILPVAQGIRGDFDVANASISGGIAIVHRTHPLQFGIQAAKDSEHQAKEVYQRNAVAIKVLRRSGEPTEFGGKWDSGIISLLTRIQEKMSQGLIAYNLAPDMVAFQYHLVPPITAAYAIQNDLEHRFTPIDADSQMAEFKRLFERRCTTKEYRESDDATTLREAISALGSDHDGLGWNTVAGMLYLARFLSQEALDVVDD